MGMMGLQNKLDTEAPPVSYSLVCALPLYVKDTK